MSASTFGLRPSCITGRAFAVPIAADIATWGRVIQEADIRAQE
jgi:tripartite-type tricarboxylate transporter receptor subunit TctC